MGGAERGAPPLVAGAAGSRAAPREPLRVRIRNSRRCGVSYAKAPSLPAVVFRNGLTGNGALFSA